MKGIFLTGIFFLSLLAVDKTSAAGNNVKLLFPQEASQAGKWEKVEVGIKLPPSVQKQVDLFVAGKNAPDRINPFDPDQLSIEALFQHCDASDTSKTDYSRTVFGFYYNEFVRDESQAGAAAWIKKNSDYPFRARFAPGKTGLWKCSFRLKTPRESVELGKVYFTCVGSASKGPVRTTSATGLQHRYLQHAESGEMFFPIGMNLPWVHLDEMKADDYKTYAKWFGQVADNGGNYIQLSMLPFTYGIEWEELGNYTARMKNAWELDQLIDLAHQKKLYVNMLLLIHDEFLTGAGWIHKNNHWTNNIYNQAKNNGKTTVADPLGFFTDATCKSHFKKRLRYILSRYGYSVNIPLLELLSEIDNAVPGYNGKSADAVRKRQEVKKWFVEMKDYIKNDLGYAEKLVGASYAQGEQAEDQENRVFSVSDVVLLHFYGRDQFTNYNQRAVDASVLLNSSKTGNKPTIYDEMGANVFPTLDRCADITFHNNLWTTAFMGSFGSGQNWWWDNALLINGSEKHFKGISRFMQEENFALKEFAAEKWINTGRFNTRTDYEAYYLKALDGTKAIGWIHNTSFWWGNLRNDNACIADLVQKNNGSTVDAADNSQYAKDYSRWKGRGTPEKKNGYRFSLKMPLGNTEYIIKWYNTVTGEPTGMTQTVKSSSSGKIKFDIPEIVYPANPYGGLGFKIVKFSK